MKWFLPAAWLAVVVLCGCDQPAADPDVYAPAVSAAIARVSLDTPGPSTPDDATERCSECKGTGRVKTGDGLSTTECDVCNGSGYVHKQTAAPAERWIDLPIVNPAKYSPERLYHFAAARTEEPQQSVIELPGDPVPLRDDCEACESCALGVCSTGGCSAECAGSCSLSSSPSSCSSGSCGVSSYTSTTPRRVLGGRPTTDRRLLGDRRPVRRVLGRLFTGRARGGLFAGSCRSCR